MEITLCKNALSVFSPSRSSSSLMHSKDRQCQWFISSLQVAQISQKKICRSLSIICMYKIAFATLHSAYFQNEKGNDDMEKVLERQLTFCKKIILLERRVQKCMFRCIKNNNKYSCNINTYQGLYMPGFAFVFCDNTISHFLHDSWQGHFGYNNNICALQYIFFIKNQIFLCCCLCFTCVFRCFPMNVSP